MKKVILGSTLFFLATFAQAQLARFESEKRDFGTLDFTDSLTARFVFTNTSGTPLKVTDVEADCGCATIAFPTWEVPANSGGVIKITYLPYKYGRFRKQFLAHFETKSRTGTQYLTLTGRIRPPKDQRRAFPYTIGPFKSESKFFSFGKITNQKPVTKRFELYNPADTNLVMTGKMNLPAHLKVFFDTSHIAYPKQTLPIFVTYDPKEKNDLGFLEDEITLHRYTQSELKPLKIRVIATVEEYFPPLTEEVLAEMPELNLSYNTINLGSVESEETNITRFILSNTGKKPLKIRKIVTDDGCQVLTPEHKYAVIAPDESVSLRVEFKDLGQTGTVSRFLTLMTNDPRHAREMLEIKAYVRK